jgi:hypothetical protein
VKSNFVSLNVCPCQLRYVGLPVAFIAGLECEPPDQHHGEGEENGSELSHWTAEKNDRRDDHGDEYPCNYRFPHGKVVVQRAERPDRAAKRDDPATRPHDSPQYATNHFNGSSGKWAGRTTMEIRVNAGNHAATSPRRLSNSGRRF